MKWRPLEADGGRTDNVIYNVIALRWRPVEADGGQVEAARDMQITIIRTTMEASGDSKVYNTIIGVTSLRPHQHHQSTFHSQNFKPQLAPSTFPIPLLLNFHHPRFLFLGPFATYFTSLVKDTCQVSFLSLSSPQLPLTNPYWSSITIDNPKLQTSHHAHGAN